MHTISFAPEAGAVSSLPPLSMFWTRLSNLAMRFKSSRSTSFLSGRDVLEILEPSASCLRRPPCLPRGK